MASGSGGGPWGDKSGIVSGLLASAALLCAWMPACTSDSEDDDAAATDDAGDGDGDGDGDDSSEDWPPWDDAQQPSGMFVAVGDGGRRAVSVDGETWDEIVGSGTFDTGDPEMPGQYDTLRGVAFGKGAVIAVGGGGSYWEANSFVARSTDLSTWDEDLIAGTEADRYRLQDVAFGGEVFVAVGDHAHAIRSGNGGTSWTATGPDVQEARVLSVAGSSDDRFVAVGWHWVEYDAPKTSFIMASHDGGQTWLEPIYDQPALAEVAWANDRFVAIDSGVCIQSQDGVSWEDCELIGSGFHGLSVARGIFWVASDQGFARSYDGITWVTSDEPELGSPSSLAYGMSRWVGVRWGERGVAEGEVPTDWSFVPHTDFPLRAITFAETGQ